MGPVGPFRHELVEEQPADNRPGKAVAARVVEVGDVGFQVFAVAIVQRQRPARIIRRLACGLQIGGGFRPAGHQRGQVWPQRDAGRAGERGEIEHQFGRLLARAGQRIAQHQPPFGIGIADLDAEAGAAAQHVAGAEGIAGNRVFHRRDHQVQPHFQPGLHHQLRQREGMGSAAHVLFHQQHAGRWLDVQPAGIEAHALANQRDAGMRGIAPVQFDHARRVAARGGAAHAVNHRKAAFQRVPGCYLEFRLVRLGDQLGFVLQLGRAHVFGGGVDQIADQRDGGGFGQRRADRLDVLGQQHARAIGGGVAAIAVKPVLPADPAEQGRARFRARAAIGSGGQHFRQLGHAPAGQAVHIGHARYHEPPVAIGQDGMGIAIADELLRGEGGALRGR